MGHIASWKFFQMREEGRASREYFYKVDGNTLRIRINLAGPVKPIILSDYRPEGRATLKAIYEDIMARERKERQHA